jgi:hypothetical protein
VLGGIAVDVTGLILTTVITAASVQDRDGARPLLWQLAAAYDSVTLIWAGGGYADQLVTWASQAPPVLARRSLAVPARTRAQPAWPRAGPEGKSPPLSLRRLHAPGQPPLAPRQHPAGASASPRGDGPKLQEPEPDTPAGTGLRSPPGDAISVTVRPAGEPGDGGGLRQA